MGRKKKTTECLVQDTMPFITILENEDISGTEVSEKSTGTNTAEINPYSMPPIQFIRNSYGLLNHINHKFNNFGFVDWKAMINHEHIVLNRESFLKKDNPIDIEKLSEEEIISLKEKCDDKDKLIKLAGYKEIAQLRGMKSISVKANYVENYGVQAVCTIKWVPNYEQSFTECKSCGLADATLENTSMEMSKYLSSIAENRAFVRAVRSFLQINIAGQDELKFEKPEEFNVVAPISTQNFSGPQSALDKKMKSAKKGFSELTQFLLSKYPEKVTGAEIWTSVSDIPSQEATFILGIFNEFIGK